jgi:hypothetical protein
MLKVMEKNWKLNISTRYMIKNLKIRLLVLNVLGIVSHVVLFYLSDEMLTLFCSITYKDSWR